jgi:glutamate/tyrosine decarboxylase-like PLP-dependent enzyme
MTQNISETAALLECVLRHGRAYLDGLGNSPVAATEDVGRLRGRLDKSLADEGMSDGVVIDDLVRDVSGGLLGSAGGRFFGWVIGGALPVALAADWLTSIWDQNAALYACSPAAAIVEEVAGAWLKDILRLPTESSFAFVTGCQMAHVTCLAAARQHVLAKSRWDVGARGLYGAPPIRILASAERHGSIDRAVSLLGLGRDNLQPLDIDDFGRVQIGALRAALDEAGAAPTIVVLQAGDIATGAFDQFEELIPLAKASGAWVHIDGAFGLWARASSNYSPFVNGVELADSWASDGHKLLNTPFDCGYAFVRHPEDHKAALSLRASYLTHAEDARDQIDWNPDWSRRARGFATYAALRSLGRKGVAGLFDRCCAHAEALAAGMSALAGAELVSAPIINQALVRFRDPRADAVGTDHDIWTDAVVATVNATGEAFFTGGMWQGRRVMRISVCNWRTTADDVERAIAAARHALSDLASRAGAAQGFGLA